MKAGQASRSAPGSSVMAAVPFKIAPECAAVATRVIARSSSDVAIW
jgi:hypothetical protein